MFDTLKKFLLLCAFFSTLAQADSDVRLFFVGTSLDYKEYGKKG
jgi:hypothetical protein